jgi:Fe-S-cluster containining protein
VIDHDGEHFGLCLLPGEKKLFAAFPDAVMPYIGIRKPDRSQIKVVAYQMVQAPCPLLGAEGCTRYADRPTACRAHPFSSLRDGVSVEMTCSWSRSHEFEMGKTQIRTGAAQHNGLTAMKLFFIGLNRRMRRTGYTRLMMLDVVTAEWIEISPDR